MPRLLFLFCLEQKERKKKRPIEQKATLTDKKDNEGMFHDTKVSRNKECAEDDFDNRMEK